MPLVVHLVLSADGTRNYIPPTPIAEITISTPSHALYVGFEDTGAKFPLPTSTVLTLVHHGAVISLYFSGTAGDAFDLVLVPVRIHFSKSVK